MRKFLQVCFIAAGFFCLAFNLNAQSGILPLNGSINGNLAAGGTDTWKLSTTADGLLRFTFRAASPADLLVSLYDNNGTTLIAGAVESFNNSTVTMFADGLATGTYFVKITPYSSGSTTGAYTLADSLFTPTQVNDAEPNGTKATALTLPLNGGKTGHVGYYYNNVRDTADWYKVTTTAEGLLRVYLTTAKGSVYSNSALDVNVTLFDNNGTTQLGAVEVYNNNNPGTGIITTDGLAPGTYYVKVQPYSTNQFADYEISDSLITPPIAIDAEPNGTKATAVTLPLNGGKTGHVGYYYNNVRDTADWYKVTTTADGLLRVYLTIARGSIYSNNALDVNATLYDNNGTTQLGAVEVYNGGNPGTGIITTDGLAPGTYYVKVQPYSTNEFADYEISDSLLTPAIAIDAEPNGTISSAIALPLNSGKTGHVGYYYNNVRDTADWYKITTSADGLLRVYLTTARGSIYSNNGLDVNATLYDINGTTQLGAVEVFNGGNPGTGFLTTDGLAAGTYYVKVQPYSTSQFADYTILDSLLTYNSNDNEPDDSAYEATTISANRTTSGHTGFYFNGGVKKDVSDWFKVNYTGTGNLKITFNLLPHLSNGALGDVIFQVYKDTAASPIFNQEFYTSPSNTFSLSSLSQGYYWIKVSPYSTNPAYFSAYTITDSFTQVNVAQIASTRAVTSSLCNNDSLVYHLSASHSPYTVTLYRFGVAYDSLKTASDSAIFTHLPPGNYYATVFGDGATNLAFGTSSVTPLLPPVPTGLAATNVTANSSAITWDAMSCVNYDSVQYRIKGSATWTTVATNSNTFNLSNLLADTTYYFRIASVDTANGQKVVSAYSIADSFKTLGLLPITLVNFNGSLRNNTAVLYWSTTNEFNNKGFEVQRSIDGQRFLAIGFVNAEANSSYVKNYSFTDTKLENGSNYYRLKQIDRDGKFTYANTIKISFNTVNIVITPNPATTFVNIHSASIIKKLQCFNETGSLILNINPNENNYQMKMDNLPAGNYFLRIETSTGVTNRKIIKQ